MLRLQLWGWRGILDLKRDEGQRGEVWERGWRTRDNLFRALHSGGVQIDCVIVDISGTDKLFSPAGCSAWSECEQLPLYF